MRLQYIHKNDRATQLLIVVCGWGFDAQAIDALISATQRDRGYDIVVMDEIDADIHHAEIRALVSGYGEVCLLGWSMGVPIAERIADDIGQRLTRCIAVAGTSVIRDDEYGIPCSIYDGTAETLNPRNLNKFLRRTAGTTSVPDIVERLSCSDTSTLATTLTTMATAYATPYHPTMWDMAYIPTDDRIIPPGNQQRHWDRWGVRTINIADGNHLPPIGEIVSERFVDKRLVKDRFANAAVTYDSNATVQARIAERLIQKIAPHSTHPREILETGCGTGVLTRMLTESYPDATITGWDIYNVPQVTGVRYRVCDAETEVNTLESDHYDVIVSASTIQWFNSPQRFIRRAVQALKPGGILAFSTFGADNLREIQDLTEGGLQLGDNDHWKGMTPMGSTLCAIENEEISLRFDTFRDALRHLSLTGVNALSRPTGTSISRLKAYTQRAGDEPFTLTYSPIYMIIQRNE